MPIARQPALSAITDDKTIREAFLGGVDRANLLSLAGGAMYFKHVAQPHETMPTSTAWLGQKRRDDGQDERGELNVTFLSVARIAAALAIKPSELMQTAVIRSNWSSAPSSGLKPTRPLPGCCSWRLDSDDARRAGGPSDHVGPGKAAALFIGTAQ